MVKIMPLHQEGEDRIAAKSFFRFNNLFRNIHELVLYPTEKSGKVCLENLTGMGPKNGESRDPIDDYIIDEAGMRMEMGNSFAFHDFDIETMSGAHDTRIESLFAEVENIREEGSVISFGMVVDNVSTTGYEFCQVELAAAQGDRVLLVGIKIPNHGNISSLHLKRQPQNENMHELATQQFLEVDQGFFTVKEYGKQKDYGQAKVNLGPRSHQFYNLELGGRLDQEVFEDYTEQVGSAFLQGSHFNATLFEEWRQMIPFQTIDRHLKVIYMSYTNEIALIAGKLNTPGMEPEGMGPGDVPYVNHGPVSNEYDDMRHSLHNLRAAKMYVAERGRDLEYERALEYDFGLGLEPNVKPVNMMDTMMPGYWKACMGKANETETDETETDDTETDEIKVDKGKAVARNTAPSPRTPEKSHNKFSTTPTSYSIRIAEIARLNIENRQLTTNYNQLASDREEMRQTLASLLADPRFYANSNAANGPDLDEETRLQLDGTRNRARVLINASRPDGYPVAVPGAEANMQGAFRRGIAAGFVGDLGGNAGGIAGATFVVDSDAVVGVIAGVIAGPISGANSDGNAVTNASSVIGNSANIGPVVDTGVPVAMNVDAGATANATASGDADLDSGDDDEEGGVRLVPEPASSGSGTNLTPPKKVNTDLLSVHLLSVPLGSASSPKKRKLSGNDN